MDPSIEQLPCHLTAGARGVAVGWLGDYGPAVASMRSPRAITPDRAVHVGLASAPVSDTPPPAIGWHRGRMVTTCIRDGRAWLDASARGERGASWCLAERATAVAHAVTRYAVAVAVVDDEGIVLHHVHPDRGDPVEHTARVVRRPDVAATLAVTPTDAGTLVVYCLEDEPVLGIVCAHGDASRDVRHRIAAPCRSLHALGASTYAAVALGLDRGRVHAALLGPGGEMRERPHEVMRSVGGSLRSPRVLWMENVFAVAAVDTATRELRVVPLDRRRVSRPGAVLPRFEPPFGVAYHDRQIVAGRVVRTDRGTRLWLSRVDRYGGSLQTIDVDVTPQDTSIRWRHVCARDAIRRLHARLATGGYRVAGARVAVDSDGMGLVAREGEGAARLRLTPHQGGVRVTLRTSPTGRIREQPASRRWPDRVRQWVRRLSAGLREGARADVEWLLEDPRCARLERAEHVADTLVVQVACDAMPHPAMLESWLQRARHRPRRSLTP